VGAAEGAALAVGAAEGAALALGVELALGLGEGVAVGAGPQATGKRQLRRISAFLCMAGVLFVRYSSFPSLSIERRPVHVKINIYNLVKI